MDPDSKLRPSQIGVIVVTAFLMGLMAASFGLGLYTLLNPLDGTGEVSSTVLGASLMVFAVIPVAGVWGMWMLWNDLARREPGSAIKKWDNDDPE